MKNQKVSFLLLCILLAAVISSSAQDTAKEYKTISTNSITKGKYTLLFINKDTALDATVKQRLIDAFFAVYPKESDMYNPNTAKKVTFIIDPAYDGVAATSGDIVRFNPEWFHKHPGDIDVVTHEVMHIVQAYPDDAGPGWITEGIADYVRYKMGVDNAGANWKLTEYNAKQNYDNSYRITARFFVWIEQNHDKDFVKQLDAAMRSKTYTDDFAREHTGKTFSELWEEYTKNAAITRVDR
ncbi:secretory protein [Ilyomonas limi]|uniref:Secretory protein n=1 Tax=Ilyomonas limi TaxID=2575867 RepID=A0A4V5UV45_9BACT|nr:basic secretory protein-like protein [Ilyomonas limi]TKK71643.1 secretory protein [Ilyomonas limi]